MSLLALAALALVLVMLAALPSASVALVVTRSVTHGTRSGIAVGAGIVLGDLLFATLALGGMSYLAETLGGFFAVFRYLGGAYLIWLGLQLLRSPKPGSTTSSAPGAGLLTSFSAGFFLTLGDLKAILFYASLFPAFVDRPALGLGGAGAILATTVVAVGGVKIAYALAARTLYRRIQHRANAPWIRTAAGGLIIGSGVWVVTKA